MARCTKCGREGNFTGDLCRSCHSGVTYVYVEQKKRVKRRNRISAWWGALYPENKPLRKKQTIIVLVFSVLLLAALIFLRPKSNVDDAQPDELTEAFRQT